MSLNIFLPTATAFKFIPKLTVQSLKFHSLISKCHDLITVTSKPVKPKARFWRESTGDLPPCWGLRCCEMPCQWRGGCAASWRGPAGRASGTWAGPGRSPAPSLTATGEPWCAGRSARSTPADPRDRDGLLQLRAPGLPEPRGRLSWQSANPLRQCHERRAAGEAGRRQ